MLQLSNYNVQCCLISSLNLRRIKHFTYDRSSLYLGSQGVAANDKLQAECQLKCNKERECLSSIYLRIVRVHNGSQEWFKS